MSFSPAASAAPPSPFSTVTVAHNRQREAQDEAAEAQCNAVQAPEAAAIARVDGCSVASRASASEQTLDRVSPRLSSALFRLRSAGLMLASMSAQLRLPRAEQGHAFDQCSLGNMFRLGRGVAQDRAEAIRLYRLAATQGDANATAALTRLGL